MSPARATPFPNQCTGSGVRGLHIGFLVPDFSRSCKDVRGPTVRSTDIRLVPADPCGRTVLLAGTDSVFPDTSTLNPKWSPALVLEALI